MYGNVTSSDVLLQDIYRLVQGKNEKCQVFATRLEESLSKIRSRFPHMMREDDVERHLCDCLFYGMVKGLKDSIRYLYYDPKISYLQLLITAIKAETETSNTKL